MKSAAFPEEFLPTDVTQDDVPKYAKLLVDLLDDRHVDQFSDREIPSEAEDFLGKERVLFIEKTKLVVKTVKVIFEFTSNMTDRKALEGHIRRVVAASKNPGKTMELISRIWKYFIHDNDSAVNPEDLQFVLESYAQEKGQKPLSYAEEFVFLTAVRELKNGKKAGDILRELDAKVQRVFDAAHQDPDETNGERSNGASRAVLEKKFHEMARIQEYIVEKIRKIHGEISA